MSDKKQAYLVYLKDISSVSNQERESVDDLVKSGNTSLLVLRKSSQTENFGIMNAITSLS